MLFSSGYLYLFETFQPRSAASAALGSPARCASTRGARVTPRRVSTGPRASPPATRPTTRASVRTDTRANCARHVTKPTSILYFIQLPIYTHPGILQDFELSFENSPSTETLDYVLLDGFSKDLKEVLNNSHIIHNYIYLLHFLFLLVHDMLLDAIRRQGQLWYTFLLCY